MFFSLEANLTQQPIIDSLCIINLRHIQGLCDVIMDVFLSSFSHKYSWSGGRPTGQCEPWGSTVRSRRKKIHEADGDNCEHSLIYITLHAKDCDMHSYTSWLYRHGFWFPEGSSKKNWNFFFFCFLKTGWKKNIQVQTPGMHGCGLNILSIWVTGDQCAQYGKGCKGTIVG